MCCESLPASKLPDMSKIMSDYDYLRASCDISEGLKARAQGVPSAACDNRQYSACSFDSTTTMSTRFGGQEHDDSSSNQSTSAGTGTISRSRLPSTSTGGGSGHAANLSVSSHTPFHIPHSHGNGNGDTTASASYNGADISHV